MRGTSVKWLGLLTLLGCANSGAPPFSESVLESLVMPRLRVVQRIAGESENGELGFRFTPPVDVDGDGVSDIAAGARFTDLECTQMGTVGIWSTASGSELAHWEGHTPDSLFGHAVLLGPDIDSDGHPDVIAAAPSGSYYGNKRGALFARSARTKRLLWSRLGVKKEGLGWDLALADDHNGDGTNDFFAGAPAGPGRGRVYLLSGKTGTVLSTFESPTDASQFGWYVDTVADADADGRRDLIVGAPDTPNGDRRAAGAVYVISSRDGRRLQQWSGTSERGNFGEIVAGLSDLDGDGHDDVVVGEPYQGVGSRETWDPGSVSVFSGASGKRLFRWDGRQPGELYGRAVAAAGDMDADGIVDIAIGAPWWNNERREKAGRFEVRSGRDGGVISSVVGEGSEDWLGWHIVPAANVGRDQRRGLVVSALRRHENGLRGAGAIYVYEIVSDGDA